MTPVSSPVPSPVSSPDSSPVSSLVSSPASSPDVSPASSPVSAGCVLVGTPGIGIVTLSLIPLSCAHGQEPAITGVSRHSTLGVLRLAPSLMGAALVFGMIDVAIVNFLHIYGLRIGFEESRALTLLSVTIVGAIVMQIPIGWLADRLDRHLILIGCAFFGIAGGVSLPFLLQTQYLIWPVVFIWGGFVQAIYTVGLTGIGNRFHGPDLANANATFIWFYGLGMFFGPILAGYSLQWFGPHGLPGFVALVSFIYVAVLVQRAVGASSKA